jgi:hypothetical protein
MNAERAALVLRCALLDAMAQRIESDPGVPRTLPPGPRAEAMERRRAATLALVKRARLC